MRAKDGTIAVLALGRKDSGEPLNSEDMALLAAVAGQIATALENARLYRQLHLKAVEIDRMREFNENILESLDDGCWWSTSTTASFAGTRAIAALYGIAREDAARRTLDEVFDAPFVEAIRAARRDTPPAPRYRASRSPPAERRTGRRSSVNAAGRAVAQCGRGSGVGRGDNVIVEDVTARVQLEEQLRFPRRWRRSACWPPASRTRSTRR